MQLGTIGIWSRQLRYGDPAEALEAASELDELGYRALWIPDIGGPVLEIVARLLGVTRRAVLATGILNVWMHDPVDVAASHAELDRDHPGRFLLGLGISHAPLIDSDQPGRYQRPLEVVGSFLDALEAHQPAGTQPARIMAALAPKMVALARERTLGTHPYLVPVEHTAWIRQEIGPDRIVAPALSVILERDADRARAIARRDIHGYLGLPNYTNCWKRLGYTDEDLAGGASDRLIDALYAWGSLERVDARLRAHQEAGADHVCLRVVTAHPNDGEHLARTEWRELAGLLAR